MTEDEMVEWHHCLNGHDLEQTPVVGDEQGSLTCCSPWGCKELDMTELLTELNKTLERQLFNVLSRLVIVFLPRSEHLLISWLHSPYAVILEPKKVKFVIASTFLPLYLP